MTDDKAMQEKERYRVVKDLSRVMVEPTPGVGEYVVAERRYSDGAMEVRWTSPEGLRAGIVRPGAFDHFEPLDRFHPLPGPEKVASADRSRVDALEREAGQWRRLFEQVVDVVPDPAHTIEWGHHAVALVAARAERIRRKEAVVKRLVERNKELRAELAGLRSMAHFTIAGQAVSPKSTAVEIKEAIVGAIKVGADSLEAEVSKEVDSQRLGQERELHEPNALLEEFARDLEKLGEKGYQSAIGERVLKVDPSVTIASLEEQLSAAHAKVLELQAALNAKAAGHGALELPLERPAVTKKMTIGLDEKTNLRVFVTAGMYDDGSLGEIFLVASKEGSFVSGLLDAFATAVSLGLQYGVPLQVFVDRFSHMRFEPDGMTGDPQFPIAKSVVDYLFRWIGARFLPPAPEAPK